MEREALILRLRAEHAKLAAEYADEKERAIYQERARAFEAQAIELENRLDLWTPYANLSGLTEAKVAAGSEA